MASCPLCAQNIDVQSRHHGALFSCPHCHGSYFIDWDGNPEPPPPTEPLPAEAPLDDAVAPVGGPAEFTPMEIPAVTETAEGVYDPLQSFEAMTLEPTPVTDDGLGEASIETPAESLIEPFVEATPEMVPEAEPLSEPAPASVPFTEDLGLAEVAEFGNADVSAGPLAYTVVVSGIELAQTFGELRDAITDSRFSWDADKMMKSIQSGRLEVTGLSATKAAILVHRLKYLPVEISWTQEIYATNPEADPS